MAKPPISQAFGGDRDRNRRVATDGAVTTNDLAFRCPRCGSQVSRHRGSIRCQSCNYVPDHGAD